MRTLLLLLAVAALAASWASAASASPSPKIEGPNGEHQVVVCKYVSTPGDSELVQTGQNPIVVDSHALEGGGFAGTFPYAFSDAQGGSLAIRWAASSQDGSLSECPGFVPPEELDCSGDTDPTNNGPTGDCAEDPQTVQVCAPDHSIITVLVEDADQYEAIGEDGHCSESLTPPDGGGTTGGTTGGTELVSGSKSLPHTGFPALLVLLVGGGLLGGGAYLNRR
jgi:hypothetical protein